jgi:hypothetical protein
VKFQSAVKIISSIILVLLILVSCQGQLESEPPVPAPAPSTSTPSSLPPEEPQTAPEPEEYVSDQIIIKFKPETTVEAQEKLHRELGTTVIKVSQSAGFQVLQIPEGKTVKEMVALYSEQSIVEYAEPNYIEHLNPETP